MQWNLHHLSRCLTRNKSCFWKAVRWDESKGMFFTKNLVWAPTQVLFLLFSPLWHKTSCTQSCCAFSPSCLIYRGEKDHRFWWNISWKPELEKTCCTGQTLEIFKNPKTKLVPWRRKCCNVQTKTTQNSDWSVTALHLYISEKLTEISTFYCFLFPEGMWQFQNINFEMSLSFKQWGLAFSASTSHFNQLAGPEEKILR